MIFKELKVRENSHVLCRRLYGGETATDISSIHLLRAIARESDQHNRLERSGHPALVSLRPSLAFEARVDNASAQLVASQFVQYVLVTGIRLPKYSLALHVENGREAIHSERAEEGA